jgi:hypothetical protein
VTLKAFAIPLILFCLCAQADELPIDGPMFDEAQYSIVRNSADGSVRTVIIRRVGPYFTTFIKQQYDCSRLQYRYLGTGRTAEKITEEPADTPWFTVRQGDWHEFVRDRTCLTNAEASASQ